MQLSTTFRGLNQSEINIANRALERQMQRMGRFADRAAILRAVVDANSPEHSVNLKLLVGGEDYLAQSTDYDLPTAITSAVDRLRSQLLRSRGRRETNRQRRISSAAA
jgi:ribosome-associated translation inhibitor RaiA